MVVPNPPVLSGPNLLQKHDSPTLDFPRVVKGWVDPDASWATSRSLGAWWYVTTINANITIMRQGFGSVIATARALSHVTDAHLFVATRDGFFTQRKSLTTESSRMVSQPC